MSILAAWLKRWHYSSIISRNPRSSPSRLTSRQFHRKQNKVRYLVADYSLKFMKLLARSFEFCVVYRRLVSERTFGIKLSQDTTGDKKTEQRWQRCQVYNIINFSAVNPFQYDNKRGTVPVTYQHSTIQLISKQRTFDLFVFIALVQLFHAFSFLSYLLKDLLNILTQLHVLVLLNGKIVTGLDVLTVDLQQQCMLSTTARTFSTEQCFLFITIKPYKNILTTKGSSILSSSGNDQYLSNLIYWQFTNIHCLQWTCHFADE